MTADLIIREARGVLRGEQFSPLAEVGSTIEVTSRSGIFDAGPDTAYFWAEEWQKGEREADEDIRAGRVVSFDNAEDALRHLREL